MPNYCANAPLREAVAPGKPSGPASPLLGHRQAASTGGGRAAAAMRPLWRVPTRRLAHKVGTRQSGAPAERGTSAHRRCARMASCCLCLFLERVTDWGGAVAKPRSAGIGGVLLGFDSGAVTLSLDFVAEQVIGFALTLNYGSHCIWYSLWLRCQNKGVTLRVRNRSKTCKLFICLKSIYLIDL